MADMMDFPKRWEDFLHDYEFEDSRRVYTNGSRLIQSFRVKQMMEHYATVRHGRWDEHGKCIVCGGHAPFWCMASTYYTSQYCPECGAKMDGDQDG